MRGLMHVRCILMPRVLSDYRHLSAGFVRETDYFINRLGLLCRFDCGFEENLQLDGGEADTNALLHQTLRSLEMTDCTDSMLGGLERHGIRTVGESADDGY